MRRLLSAIGLAAAVFAGSVVVAEPALARSVQQGQAPVATPNPAVAERIAGCQHERNPSVRPLVGAILSVTPGTTYTAKGEVTYVPLYSGTSVLYSQAWPRVAFYRVLPTCTSPGVLVSRNVVMDQWYAVNGVVPAEATAAILTVGPPTTRIRDFVEFCTIGFDPVPSICSPDVYPRFNILSVPGGRYEYTEG